MGLPTLLTSLISNSLADFRDRRTLRRILKKRTVFFFRDGKDTETKARLFLTILRRPRS